MVEYAALDLETTGFDPDHDRVIELGAVAFTTEAVVDRLDLLVDPGRSVPASVVRLTGIQPEHLRGAASPRDGLDRLAAFLRGRQPVGHGAALDVDFLRSADVWSEDAEILDTLHLARILMPGATSHSLPLLAAELGLDQPRPHRALDDADATRQLFLRLREEARRLEESLKESMLALVAPYGWAVARFFAEALTQAAEQPEGVEAWGTAERRSTRPIGEIPRDDPAFLADLFGGNGPLAAAMPGYEPREPQVQMLLAVAQTFKRGGTLVVEAGTGTGKSLAYLVPALARALSRHERVVVSTHTHTLQEQLMGKDLPALREWLPWDFHACLLKGRANYISLRRWRRFLAEPCLDEEELRFKLKLLVWLHGTETGDRSELRLQGREEVMWGRVASDPLDCAGMHCSAEDCFVHRARADAEQADLVVVNHALLVADAKSEGAILPAYEHLVVDEAHHLEDVATQALRSEVDSSGLLALLDRLLPPTADEGRHLGGLLEQLPHVRAGEDGPSRASALAAAARTRLRRLFDRLDAWSREAAEASRREEVLRLTPELVLSLPPLADDAQEASDALFALTASLAQLMPRLEGTGEDVSANELTRELETIRARLDSARTLIHEAFLEGQPNTVYWLATPQRSGSLAVRSAPLLVADLLLDNLYRDRATVVFTSASLTVGGSFDYFRQRVGLVREPETLVLESPFDYLGQALVCLPNDLAELDDPAFETQLPETIAGIAGRIGGRTLVLFTSHTQLRDTYVALKQRSDLDEVLILGQGMDGQRRQLLKTFSEAERPLLLGTAGFWEGIDIPGDQLSCVVVVRLPFPVPTEPVFAARAEQYRDPFRGFALPQAVLRLKQGFGRLIRTSEDRGAVVLLDRRISSRDYGNAFLEALPPVSIYDGPLADLPLTVEQWLAVAD